MLVLILSLAPSSTKGYASRFLLEVSTGVFVGVLNKRVRDSLWEFCSSNLGAEGRALLIYRSLTPQGYTILIQNYARRQVKDIDGIFLVQESSKPEEGVLARKGWSNAVRYNRQRNNNKQKPA